jgi:hypothetical protein
MTSDYNYSIIELKHDIHNCLFLTNCTSDQEIKDWGDSNTDKNTAKISSENRVHFAHDKNTDVIPLH